MLYAKPAIVLKNLCTIVSPSTLYHVNLEGLDSLSEQIKYAHAFHHEPDERPPHQDQKYASPKCRATSPFLLSREE